MDNLQLSYKDEVGEIYCGDMSGNIDNLKFDYIITDPPYNIGAKYPDYDDKLTDEEYIEMISYMNKYPTVIIHQLEAFCGLIGEAMGIPEKISPWVYNSNLMRQCKGIAWYNCYPNYNKVKQLPKDLKDKRVKNKFVRSYDWIGDIQPVKAKSAEKVKSFYNQMPVKLLEKIILFTTNEGDTILDPFHGSGSTYFACRNTGRKYIGIEQSEKHLKSFFERLNN